MTPFQSIQPDALTLPCSVTDHTRFYTAHVVETERQQSACDNKCDGLSSDINQSSLQSIGLVQQQVFSRDNSHTGDVHMVEITPDVMRNNVNGVPCEVSTY